MSQGSMEQEQGILAVVPLQLSPLLWFDQLPAGEAVVVVGWEHPKDRCGLDSPGRTAGGPVIVGWERPSA